MKTPIIISILIFTLASCDNSRIQDKQKEEAPNALQDKSSSYDISSKRGYDDLVESLYDELVGKTPELKKLENKIDNLNESESDSTELFEKYNGKNQAYYYSADRHVEQIKDSILRDKMKIFIGNSLTKYNSSINKHRDLLKSINIKNVALNDIHTILKITNTLPLIEKYQKNNMPSTIPLQEFSKQLDEIINYADTLSKR